MKVILQHSSCSHVRPLTQQLMLRFLLNGFITTTLATCGDTLDTQRADSVVSGPPKPPVSGSGWGCCLHSTESHRRYWSSATCVASRGNKFPSSNNHYAQRAIPRSERNDAKSTAGPVRPHFADPHARRAGPNSAHRMVNRSGGFFDGSIRVRGRHPVGVTINTSCKVVHVEDVHAHSLIVFVAVVLRYAFDGSRVNTSRFSRRRYSIVFPAWVKQLLI